MSGRRLSPQSEAIVNGASDAAELLKRPGVWARPNDNAIDRLLIMSMNDDNTFLRRLLIASGDIGCGAATLIPFAALRFVPQRTFTHFPPHWTDVDRIGPPVASVPSEDQPNGGDCTDIITGSTTMGLFPETEWSESVAKQLPITLRVMDGVADLRDLVHRELLSDDGVIDDQEQAILDGFSDVQGTIIWWDQWRREAVYLIDHGSMTEHAPSAHHERSRGEIVALYPDGPDDGAPQLKAA